MPQIQESIAIDAPAEAVWAIAGDPGRIAEWLPALGSSSTQGDERTCTTADGGEIRERILEHSDDERTYVYEITEAPLPLSGYRSRFSVDGHGDHSHVLWSAEFSVDDPAAEDDVVKGLSGMYREGLATLQQKVEGSPQSA